MAQITEQQYKDAYAFYRRKGLNDKAQAVAEQYKQFQANQQPAPAPQPVDYQFSESAKNFLPSLGSALGDLYYAVSNPVDTAVAVGNLARSGVANAGQILQDALPESAVSNMNRFGNAVGLREQPVDNAKDYRIPGQEAGEEFAGMLDNRYGSWDATKTTMMQDPAGVLLDASSLLTGGGTAVARLPGTMGRVGQKVRQAGEFLDPITGAIKAPVAALEAYTGKPLSNTLYESAMKPSTTLSPAQRKKLVEDGLEFGATPTARSVDKLEAQKQKVFREIEDMEDASQIFGKLSDPQDLFKYVDDVRNEYAPPILNSGEALRAIDKVVEQQLEAIYLNGGQQLSVQDLARIKRKIYEQVSFDKSFGKGNIDKPSEKTMKAIARSAKEAIEELLPGVREYNELYGDIANVQRKLQVPAANRVGNRDMMGIGAPLKTGVGGAVGGQPGAVVGAGLGILDMPVAKANAAIAIKDAGKAVRSRGVSNAVVAGAIAGRYEQAVLADEEERERERQERELKRQD